MNNKNVIIAILATIVVFFVALLIVGMLTETEKNFIAQEFPAFTGQDMDDLN
jgi:lipopolysaccharide export system protein LptC